MRINLQKHRYILLFVLFLITGVTAFAGANISVTFTKAYKATSFPNDVQANSLTIGTPLPALSTIVFTQMNANKFSGNAVPDKIVYDSLGAPGKIIYGYVQRLVKTGNKINGYYFVVTADAAHTLLTGDAYLLVDPYNGSTITDNTTQNTSSDPPAKALNALWAKQNGGALITIDGVLSNFETCQGSPSASQSFTVTGTNLGANTITVNAPTGYEIALSSTYSASITLTAVGGTVTTTTINTRLTSTAVAANVATATITCTSSNVNADDQTIDVTGTVNPTSVGGTVSSTNTTICSGSTASLTLSGHTGSVTKWQSSVNGGVSWVDIASTSASLTTAALTQTTQFRAVVTSGTCASANSSALTITVSAASVGGTISSTNATVCSGSTASLTLSGQTGTVSKWQSSTDGIIWSDIASTSTSLTTSALTQTTSFRAVVVSGVCSSANSSALTITVSATSVGGTVSSTKTAVCSAEDFSLTLSGQTGTISKWQFSSDGGSSWTDYPQTSNPLPMRVTLNAQATQQIESFRAVVVNSGCPSANSGNIAITVSGVSVGGTVSSNNTNICSGGTASLTLSGQTGTVSKWQSSTDGNAWSDIANTSTSLTTAALTQTTSYRAVVVNGVCSSANSSVLTITVGGAASIGGTVSSANTTICSGGTASLTLSGQTGTVSKWQSSTDGVSWLDIASTSTSLTTAALTQTTQFRAVVVGGCSPANSSALTITVSAASVGGTVSSANTAICSGSTASLTLSGQTGTVSKWQSSTDGTGWVDIASTSTSLTTSALTQTTSFRAVVVSGVCSSANSSSLTITVSAASVGGTVSSTNTTLCSGSTASLTLSGQTGNVSKWQSSTDGIAWSDIANTSTSLTTSALTQTTSFRAVVVNGACSSANSSVLTITVSAASVGGTVSSGNTAICSGSTASLTLSGQTGNVSKWQSSTDGIIWSDIASTSTSLTTSALTQTTQFRAVVVSGVCSSANSSALTITVNASVGGTVSSANTTICSGATASLTLSGQKGTVNRWESSTDGVNWSIIFNTSTSLTTPALTQTAQFRAVMGGGCTPVNSSALTITVNSTSVGGTIAGAASVCTGTNSTLLTLSGQNGTINKWQSSTVSDFSASVTDINNTGTTYTASNLTATTYYRAVVTNGVCSSANSGIAAVTVNALPVITITPSSSVVRYGASIVLTAAGADTYTWAPSAGLSGTTTAAVTATPLTTTVYTVTGVVSATGCINTTTAIVTTVSVINPDFGVTNVNVPLNGNVATNDVAPGSTYGTPVAQASNPTGATITMNTNGTYVFTATQPGVYTYYVPVCAAGQSINCRVSPLVITVNDPTIKTNPPVANADIATVAAGSSVTVDELLNDKCSNPGCSLNPASVTVVTNPTNGVAVVNANGTITYTPAAGFSGTDSLTYRVCDNSTPVLCKTALIYYTVTATTPGVSVAPVTVASDDYTSSPAGTPATGGVLGNDRNTANATLSVTNYTTPPATQGTLVMNPDGTYVFTPAPGFSGPVDIVYTVCGGTPAACATATLHILINPAPVLNPDFGVTNINVPLKGSVATNDIAPGSTYGTPVAQASNPQGGNITLNPDGTYTFTGSKPGVYTYYVPVCAAGQTVNCPTVPLVITVNNPLVTTNPPVANADIATVTSGGSVTVDELMNDQCSNLNCSLNPASVVIVTGPTKGSAVVNANGKITYTSTAGFIGTDSLTYRMCDNSGMCKTAVIYLTVVSGSVYTPPSTYAADDHVSTSAGNPVTGNVLGNDKNTAGSTLTVTSNAQPLPTQGTLVMKTDGSYVFTPAPGFSGPVEVAYTVCSGLQCATATLHILINEPIPALVVGNVGILTDPVKRTTLPSNGYCSSANSVALVSNSAVSGGSGIYQYQWQRSADNTVFTDISGATDSIYTTGLLSTNTYFRRKVTSDYQVGYTSSVLVKVFTVVKPVISASGPLTLAVNGSVTLSSTTAATYLWSNNATSASIVVTSGTVGTYTVSATDANGCVSASDPVTVMPPPPVTINATYIVGALNSPANSGVQVTGFTGARLNYYLAANGGTWVTVPAIPSAIGVYTYYVSQTINGLESARVLYTVTMLDPYKVADIQKKATKAAVLQADGSYIIGFTIVASNLRTELLDSVRIKDDLTKVFVSPTKYTVVDIKASGKLVVNTAYDGISQTDMILNGSQLAGFTSDSVMVTLRVYPNGNSGGYNNTAEMTSKSPYGIFRIYSNDPLAGDGVSVRNPTKLIIPAVDLFIPSGFSPNRDGVNDLFVIIRPYNVKISLQVFNRWGNEVYMSNDYNNTWDGRENRNRMMGQDLPDGTYYYIVLATDGVSGSVRKFTGIITLKR